MRGFFTVAAAVAAMSLAGQEAASAQMRVELLGTMGYSQADVDALAGQEALLPDQFAGGVSATVLFGSDDGPARFGGELAFERLLSYETSVDGARDQNTLRGARAMALVRLPLGAGPAFAEAAGGAHFIGDGANLGLAGAIGSSLRLAPTVSMPVKLRVDVILGAETTIVPITLSSGIAFGLGG